MIVKSLHAFTRLGIELEFASQRQTLSLLGHLMGSHVENEHGCARSRYNQTHLLERDNLGLLRR